MNVTLKGFPLPEADIREEMLPHWLGLLRQSAEQDPGVLFQAVAKHPDIPIHGPQHHSVVPAVLLAAYHNCGGDIDLDKALGTAVRRGGQVPPGICGFWGTCGAAVGAGIYAGIITGSTPLNAPVWGIPQRLAARCLEAIAEEGGPRCCKRVSRTAIGVAARFTQECFGVSMPVKPQPCTFHEANKECLAEKCRYHK